MTFDPSPDQDAGRRCPPGWHESEAQHSSAVLRVQHPRANGGGAEGDEEAGEDKEQTTPGGCGLVSVLGVRSSAWGCGYHTVSLSV